MDLILDIASAILGALILPLLLQILVIRDDVVKYLGLLWTVVGLGSLFWLYIVWRQTSSKRADELARSEMTVPKALAVPTRVFTDPPRLQELFGREADINRVCAEVDADTTSVIVVVGLPGVGKTSLLAHSAARLRGGRHEVRWFSLSQAAPFRALSDRLVASLDAAAPPSEPNPATTFEYLAAAEIPIVLMLDNMETIFDAEGVTYRPGYEAYGEFVEMIASSDSPIKLVIGSTLRPPGHRLLTAKYSGYWEYPLHGISNDPAVDYLREFHLDAEEQSLRRLAARCDGIPLAMRMAAIEALQRYGGSVELLLSSNSNTTSEATIERQFARLSGQERDILFALCLFRELASVDDLQATALPEIVERARQGALHSLVEKAMIEGTGDRYYLLGSVDGFVTSVLVNRLVRELAEDRDIDILARFRLVNIAAFDYIQDSQINAVIVPVCARTLARYESPSAAIAAIQQLLTRLPTGFATFTVSNVMDLLTTSKLPLRGLDISGLTIRGVDFRAANLAGVLARGARFEDCRFGERLGLLLGLAVAPSGDFALVGTSDMVAHAWELVSLKPVWKLAGHEDWVRSVAVSPDSSAVATGADDGSVRIWGVANGEVLASERFPGAGKVTSLKFGSDDIIYSAWDDGAIRKGSIRGGHITWAERWLCDSPLLDLAADDQGRIAVGCAGGTIRVLKGSNLADISTLPGCGHAVQAVCFIPGTKSLVTGCSSGEIIVWDLETAAVTARIKERGEPVWSLSASVDGLDLACGDDNGVWLWRMSPKGATLRSFIREQFGRIRGVAFHPDGKRIVTVGENRVIRLVNLASGDLLRSTVGISDAAWTTVFRRGSGELAVGMGDGRILIWRRQQRTGEWREVNSWSDTGAGVWGLTYSHSNRWLVTAARSNTFYLRDANTLEELRSFVGHTGWVKATVFSRDSTRVFSSAEDGTVRIWSTLTGKQLGVLDANSGWVRSLALTNADDRLVTSCDDSTIRVWDVASSSVVASLRGHEGWVWCVRLIGDDLVVSSGEDGTVRFWSLEDGSLVRTIAAHKQRVRTLAVNVSTGLLATASDDGTAAVWSFDGTLLHRLTGHTKLVRSVEFTDSGDLLATASFDGTVRLWSPQTGQQVDTLAPVRPYEGLLLTDASGMSPAEIEAVIDLGAVQ